ncbi:protein of unknown function [Xenorhabdus doucetiae]|uniref:Uncharacterized protein n=1 Tax=Xenorhabdus doucetiae TaxID=351671 RepID=A0A068QU90_9GAMM|nr:protein of unknown function [Xenorhabdus doucetiae]
MSGPGKKHRKVEILINVISVSIEGIGQDLAFLIGFLVKNNTL